MGSDQTIAFKALVWAPLSQNKTPLPPCFLMNELTSQNVVEQKSEKDIVSIKAVLETLHREQGLLEQL